MAPGRIIGSAADGRFGLARRPGEKRIELLIQLLLDESAASGRGLEFSRKAQMLGAPYAEHANALDADVSGSADAVDVGEAFQSLKQLIIRQTAQFRDGLVQPLSRDASLAAIGLRF